MAVLLLRFTTPPVLFATKSRVWSRIFFCAFSYPLHMITLILGLALVLVCRPVASSPAADGHGELMKVCVGMDSTLSEE